MIYIGVDIGGTSIKTGFVNEQGQIISRFVIKIIKGEEQAATIKKIGEAINQHIKEHDYQDIVGIGIGCPGAINSTSGYCDYSPNLKWEHLDVCGILSEVCHLKVKIANDANVAVLGEVKFGIAKNYRHVVMLTLGTGVGGGLYLDDELYEGNEGKGAELGHSLLEYNGRLCGCGKRGCLEAYASATALINDTKKAMMENTQTAMWDYVNHDIDQVDGKTAFETAKKGDVIAKKVVEQYINYLSAGILSFCNIFRPEAVILGGGICAQKDYLIKPIEQILKQQNYGIKNTPEVKILVAKLGNDAGILGAAALLFE